MGDWIDVSSYSQNDKARTPRSFEFKAGAIRIVVTRHIYAHPDQWVLRCDPFFELLILSAKEIGAAKREALSKITVELRRASRDIGMATVEEAAP